MDKRIRIYTASKLSEASRWRLLKEAWPEVEFTARWPFKHVEFVPDIHTFATVFWDHDLEDVNSSDGVLIYGEPDHKLRGALVEVGMALALGKFVIAVGDHEDYSTWQYHRNVYRVHDLEEAKLLLLTMSL